MSSLKKNILYIVVDTSDYSESIEAIFSTKKLADGWIRLMENQSFWEVRQCTLDKYKEAIERKLRPFHVSIHKDGRIMRAESGSASLSVLGYDYGEPQFTHDRISCDLFAKNKQDATNTVNEQRLHQLKSQWKNDYAQKT
jgi:hypothetical protein